MCYYNIQYTLIITLMCKCRKKNRTSKHYSQNKHLIRKITSTLRENKLYQRLSVFGVVRQCFHVSEADFYFTHRN